MGRERLTRERILRATLRVVDEDGMGALSIRRLAAELGVDPMVIYHHLPGKEAGLSGIVEMVYGRCTRRPIPALRGRTSCARTRTLRNLTRAHSTLVLYLVSNPRAGAVAALEANEALFGALVRAVFTPRVVLRAAELVVNYVNGFAPGEAGGPLGGPGEREWFRALLEAQPADKFPAIHRVYDGVTEAGSPSDFEYGLGVILAGLEASRIQGGEEEAR